MSAEASRKVLLLGATGTIGRAVRAEGIQDFRKLLAGWRPGAGPTLVHLRIRPGSPEDLARPGEAPAFYARRFRAFLRGENR